MKAHTLSTGDAGNAVSLVIAGLEDAIKKGNAHASFEEAAADIPYELMGEMSEGLPYSLWQLVEHIRITQEDILEFCRNPHYKALAWPDDYWPKEKAPAHKGDLKRSVDRMLADRKAFIGLLHQSGEGIFNRLPHGDGQNLFREALLIIDHTSYHTGEIIILRRLLGNWK